MNNNINALHATNLHRRNAIKQLASFCGLALSATSLDLIAASAKTKNTLEASPGLLNANQLALIRQLGEVIIPTTETPGAIAAGVHTFISHYAADAFSLQEQQQLLLGLEKIEKASKKLWHKTFIKASSKQQISLLTDMEKAQGEFDSHDRIFFKQLKGLVIFGYYTSEIGATQELAYLAIPGGFKGDVKFTTVGKAWAL